MEATERKRKRVQGVKCYSTSIATKQPQVKTKLAQREKKWGDRIDFKP